MKQTATLRYVRMAPRKVRLVADMIKGLTVNEAEAQLMHERRRAAKPLLKLLRSATANAKSSKKATGVEGFVIETLTVDNGPMLKRFLPRARGSATPIQKKMSHVVLVLSDEKGTKEPKYQIIVKKKKKKTEESKKRTAEKTSKNRPRDPREDIAEGSGAKRKDEPGILKRVFRRKSV